MKNINIKAAFKDAVDVVKGRLSKQIKAIRHIYRAIKTWVGIRGLLQIQTCVVFVGIFNMVMDGMFAGILTLILAVTKSCYDKYLKGSMEELHDFTCCLVGVLIGIILSVFHEYLCVI